MMILQQTRGALSSGGFEPIAARYIAAVEGAGATVNTNQRNAINAFIKSGKANGWLSSMRRIYLPIWGIAAPNAIDIMSTNSGTFVGAPTYSSSSVSFANGAYFNCNIDFPSQGLTVSSGYIFTLVTAWNGTFNSIAGNGSSGNTTVLSRTDANNLRFRYSGTTEGSGQVAATGNAGTLGLISGSREGGLRRIYRRIGSSRSQVATLTSGNFGSVVSSSVFFAGSNNTDTSALVPVTAACTLGTFGFGLGLTDAQDSAFTLSLKSLWETCTGAILP